MCLGWKLRGKEFLFVCVFYGHINLELVFFQAELVNREGYNGISTSDSYCSYQDLVDF